MGTLEQLANQFAKLIKFDTWGNYPAGYDPAKHGPYDPSRYYGKRKSTIFRHSFNLQMI